jgi:large repetitive protein
VQGNPAIRTIRNMTVFDRWGSKVFQAQNIAPNDEEAGWNGNFRGQALNPAVFVYYIEVEFLDGEIVIVKGDVTLVR